MRCKQGDLAHMTHITSRTVLVEVLSRYTGKEFAGKLTTEGVWRQPCWLVKSLGGPIKHTGQGKAHQVVPCPDAWLKPIRDPGDDARDESLEWKPVPVTAPTKEHA